MGIKGKLTASMLAIVIVLLVACLILTVQFGEMSVTTTEFFRSFIPSMVAVGVGILLILLLWFYLIVFYVRPLDKIVKNLNSYKSFNKKYNVTFDGDDRMSELNDSITELVEENMQLRSRFNNLRRNLSNPGQNNSEQ